MRKQILFFYFLTVLSLSFVFGYTQVLADDRSAPDEAFYQLRAAGNQGAGFGEAKDPREVAARIIKIALGVLGTIFLVLIVYAGVLWMTAAGEEEGITKATSILKTSVIGLAIILSAYALTIFVAEKLIQGTTGADLTDFCVANPADPSCAL